MDTVDVEAMMREALAEAKAAGEAGEYPIGAVVVIDGAVISRGRSRQRELRSQLAHAELEALQRAGDLLWTRHDDAVLFTTVEPCPLCLGAAVMADVPHIVFAHPRPGDPVGRDHRPCAVRPLAHRDVSGRRPAR